MTILTIFNCLKFSEDYSNLRTIVLKKRLSAITDYVVLIKLSLQLNEREITAYGLILNQITLTLKISQNTVTIEIY